MRHRKLFPALCLLFVTACSGGLQEAYEDSQYSQIPQAWVIGPKAPCKITTVAGGGSNLANDIPATDAKLSQPQGIAVDAAGNVYFADVGRHCVRKVDTDGKITTVAGQCTDIAPASGSGDSEDLATNVSLRYPQGLALYGGALYITESGSSCIKKVDLATQKMVTVAGQCGNTASPWSGEGLFGTAAQLYGPAGITADASGNIYFTNLLSSGFVIKMTPNGVTHHLTGTYNSTTVTGAYTDPKGVAVDGFGNVYTAAASDKCIHKYIRATGTDTVAAGICSDSGTSGRTPDGEVMDGGTDKLDGIISGIAADSQGNYYFLEPGYSSSLVGKIRRIDAGTKIITTIAGGGSETGDPIDSSDNASLNFGNGSTNYYMGLTLAPDGSLYFADFTNNGTVLPPRIRKCTP